MDLKSHQHNGDWLRGHLEETLHYIRRHRGRVMLGGQGFSDVPSFSGFKAKAPCNGTAMETADMEARAVGRLAVYCMNLGAIPYRPMPGFWFIRGRCMGLLTTCDWDEYDMWGNRTGVDVLAPIVPLIEHLHQWADTIVRVEGVAPYLDDCAKIRRYSMVCFPQEVEQWLTVQEAAEKYGMAERTLFNLATAGAIRALVDDYGVKLFQDRSIELWKDTVRAKRLDNMRKINMRKTQNPSV